MSSQSDTEKADLHKERFELANNPDAELEELTEIYRRRGLSDPLATEVAKALMEHDALAAHARDENRHYRNLCRPTHAGRAGFCCFILCRSDFAFTGRIDSFYRHCSDLGSFHFVRTGRTGLCLRQTRWRACHSRRFARVFMGRCGIGDNRIYWKTGGCGRLIVRPYILLNLYPVKLKIYLIAKGRT